MRSASAVARSTSRKASRSVNRANKVRDLREEQLLTKAELARKAGISPLTLTRIESGCECRVDTMRKIIFALGLKPADRNKVFGATPASRKGR